MRDPQARAATGTAGRQLIHATTVALGSVAAVLRGPSGIGKSDLALRFLSEQGRWPGDVRERRLVADDQTWLSLEDGRLIATAPVTIAGKVEVRGVGIVDVPTQGPAEVRLVVDLVPSAEVERFPDPLMMTELLGISVPLRRLAPFETSAPLKLALLLADVA